MSKYKIRFSREHGSKLFQTIVEANNETEAFLKARDEAKSKGINLPNEVWTRTQKIKGGEQ
jgi:hypothetical protein